MNWSNGGIFFATEFQDSGWPAKGFEVQVNNSHTDRVKSGSLYHVKDVYIDDIKDIVLAQSAGTPVLLRDVADIKIGHAVRLGINGRDADPDVITVVVLMQKK